MSSTDVCRLCLKVVPSDDCTPLDVTLTEKLQVLEPELKLIPTVNPVVCNTCKESLEEAHKLKRTCTSSNKLIKFLKNYLGIKHCIELKELIKGNNKKDENWPRHEHICRICLKSNEGSYKTMKDAKSDEFGSILETCLSTLDENLTANPLICKLCTDTLYKMCSFIKQFTGVENKIKTYCEKVPSEKVDLSKVLELKIEKEEGQSALQNPDEAVQSVSNEKIERRKRPLTEESNNDAAKKQKMDIEFVEEEDKNETSHTEETVDSGTATDELPYFDFSLGTVFAPYRRKISIRDWTKQVEEIKSRLKWSDSMAKLKVIAMIKKMPKLRSWLSSIADVISWEEFKEKVAHTFANEDDHYFRIVRMVQRTRRPTETYVEYYHLKLSLLEPLGFSEEQVISCLLGGITDIFTNCVARMGNYKKREELLAFFTSWDDKREMHSSKEKTKGEILMKRQIEAEEKLWDEDDFASDDFFKIDNSPKKPEKSLIVLLEKKRFDIGQKPSGENSKAPESTCTCCDQKGHSSLNCPLLVAAKITQKTDAEDRGIQTKNLIVALKSISTENLTKTDAPTEAVAKENDKKEGKTVSSHKCACCDKVGHSSLDCPLIKGKVSAPQAPERYTQNSEKRSKVDDKIDTPKTDSEENDQNQSSFKCSFCDKTGHSSLVCPLIDCENISPRQTIKIVLDKDRLNKTKPSSSSPALPMDDLDCEMVQNKVESTSKGKMEQKKCSSCNKTGHTTTECPLTGLNKQPEKRESSDGQKKCAGCNKIGHSITECPLTGFKKQSETRQSPDKQKICTGCNKTGHPATECPLTGLKKQSEKSQSSDKQKICTSCNKTGHSATECSLTGLNKRPEKRESSDRQKMCAGCNKTGHSVTECPLTGFQKQPEKKQSSDKLKICTNCNKAGHSATECSLTGLKQPEKRGSSEKEKKCAGCNKTGHSITECPLTGFQKQPEKQKSSDKQKMCTSCNKSGHSATECSLTGLNKQAEKRGSSEKQKGAGCNKTGHSITECRLTGFQKQSEKKQSSDKQKICTSCKKTGHSATECSLTGFNKQPEKRGSSEKQKKCASCNKTGHSITECRLTGFQKQSEKKQSSDKQKICTSCKKTGHSATECFLTGFNKQPEKRGSSEKQKKCASCNKTGHSITECRLTGFQKQSEKKQSSDKQKTCTSCKKTGHLATECSLTGLNKRPERRESSDRQKMCASCNKTGHSITDCPLAGIKRQSEKRQSSDKQKICTGCNKTGHVATECPLTGFSKESDKRQHKCSKCKQPGHTRFSCPLIKVNNIPSLLQNETFAQIARNETPLQQPQNETFVHGTFMQRPQIEMPVQMSQNEMWMPQTGVQIPQNYTSLQKLWNQTSLQMSQNEIWIRQTPVQIPRNDVSLQMPLMQTFQNETSIQMPQNQPPMPAFQNCSNCNNVGHSSVDCPFVGFKSISSAPTDKASLKRRCLCCNQIGHSSLDCVLLKQRNSNKQPENAPQLEEKCSYCKKIGHVAVDCAFYKFFNKKTTATAENTSAVKGASERLPNDWGKAPEVPQQSTSWEKANDGPANQKCSLCGKVGHSSIECFKIRFEQKHGQSTNVQQSSPHGQKRKQEDILTCEYCCKVGHRMSECYYARLAKKSSEPHHSLNFTSSRQCLYCGKFGHMQADCPKSKPHSLPITGVSFKLRSSRR